jgi:CheY-like chemotaxis protein
VVEDEPDTRKTYALLLQGWGHVPLLARDGVTALHAVDEHAPDVILLDLALPHLDGLQLAKAIRGRWPYQPPLLIAVTGYGTTEDRHRTRAAGIDFHSSSRWTRTRSPPSWDVVGLAPTKRSRAVAMRLLDGAHAALADRLEQLVRADDRAGCFGRRRRGNPLCNGGLRSGGIRPRRGKWTAQPVVGGEQGRDFGPQARPVAKDG